MSEIKTFRREIKYIISLQMASLIKSELSRLIERDTNGNNGSYIIKSLYFDSLNNMDYYDKLDGIENRKKVRLRIYDSEDTVCKLEIKQKYGNDQLKESLVVSREDAVQIIQGDYSVLKKYFERYELSLRIYNYLVTESRNPVAIIQYDRTAFRYHLNDVRITFDSNIRTTMSEQDIFVNNTSMLPVLYDHTILEVKYNGCLPGFISAVLAKYDLTETSYSKYSLGREVYYR